MEACAGTVALPVGSSMSYQLTEGGALARFGQRTASSHRSKGVRSGRTSEISVHSGVDG